MMQKPKIICKRKNVHTTATVHIVVTRNYRGVPYTIETTLQDLKQTAAIGKVMRALESWINKNLALAREKAR